MSDSLMLGNAIELLGAPGGVVSQIPACAGAVFQLAYNPGMDLGGPQPTTDFVASLILDGERPFGRRASNRLITLPVKISVPGVTDPGTRTRIMIAAREVLGQVIDQDVWTLTWSRDPGSGTRLPLILDCFRAQPSKPVYDPLIEERGGVMQITLTIPALPYGRSDTQYTPAFTGAVPLTPTPPPPPAPVILDNYSTISSPQFTQSTQCAVGPFTALWDPDTFGDPGGQSTALTYSARFTAPVDLTAMTSLQFWLGLGSRYYPFLEYPGRVHGVSAWITLTDINGASLPMSRSDLRLPVTPVAQVPVFSRVSIPFPAASAVFAYSQVAGYTLTVVSRQDRGLTRLQWVTAYLDNLTAYPSTQTVTPVTRGNLYTLYGLLGTARAPMSLSFQQPPSAGSPTTVTATGSGTYTVPSNTAYVKVEAWGAGGAGGSRSTAGDGGGGGGGEYAREDLFACSPGDVIPYSVGTGGTAGASPVDGAATFFGPGPAGPMVVQANGGRSVAQNSITGGAGGDGSVNSVHYPGGTGRTASGSVGGGGGSSAGTGAPGQSPVGTAADLFTTSGAQTWVAPAGVFQVFAECWGAGGSGASGGSGETGAGGGGGEYAAGFVSVTPGNTYNLTVGAGGASVSGTDSNGHAGTGSVFTGDSATITAHPGAAGQSKGWPGGGGGAGGSGSSASVHFSGGDGGSAAPYSGGGGSSAGSAAGGNDGNGYGGAGTAPADGGGGGAGSGAGSGTGSDGAQPGGGGGGTHTTAATGNGADGQVRLTYPGGAPTNNGAAAVPGGGAGGAGGASSNTAGSAGSQPGGGGGGADSGGTSEAGGAGGAGKLVITPYASAAFKNLIVHRPPLGALKTFQPLVSVGGGSDAPDGTHEYRMPQPITGLNADFGGTYTILLIASSLSGSGSRTITVTVNQYEFSGGPKYSAATLAISITPAQVTNGVITAGVLTLPIRSVAPDNTGGYFTITPFSSNSADRFADCIFLDTQGSSVNVNRTSGYATYYIDEPQPNLALGYVLGSNGGRPDAISVLSDAMVSGGPLALEPADGDNQLFCYSADGTAPVIAVSYYPRWYYDRYQ